ncbi:MAG: helix-turn-helix domain-containing protein [Clostridia bacterium]|nr:helix-turn-helix domain-containing protein [Clostridia bacterium]
MIQQSGMSQTAIAKALGISQQAVSAYVYGTNMPALDTLANLCKLLDEDTNYVLCQD